MYKMASVERAYPFCANRFAITAWHHAAFKNHGAMDSSEDKDGLKICGLQNMS
jgi:hypothetical protein